MKFSLEIFRTYVMIEIKWLQRTFYQVGIQCRSMGFLKKIKDSTEKGEDLGKQGIEKGAEIGTKAYDGTKDAAKKGHEKAKKE